MSNSTRLAQGHRVRTGRRARNPAVARCCAVRPARKPWRWFPLLGQHVRASVLTECCQRLRRTSACVWAWTCSWSVRPLSISFTFQVSCAIGSRRFSSPTP